MGEKFCLRWRDFETSVSSSFRELRAESDFFDLTIGCSDPDGRTIQAHKVILSACSSYFKNILRKYNDLSSKPFVYLKGVSYKNLSSILDFMYNGEVTVLQEHLDSFLVVTGELKIKGLVNKDGSIIGRNLDTSEETKDIGITSPVFIPPSTSTTFDSETINVDGEPTFAWYDDDDEKNVLPVNDDIKEMEDPTDAFMSIEDSRWSCKTCQIPFRSIDFCRRHVEDKHLYVSKNDKKEKLNVDNSFKCSRCSFKCKSKFRLQFHETTNHDQQHSVTGIKNELDFFSDDFSNKRRTRAKINYAEADNDDKQEKRKVMVNNGNAANDNDEVINEPSLNDDNEDDVGFKNEEDGNNNNIDKKDSFLKYHLIEHLNDSTKRTKCTECDKIFSSWAGAKQHLLIVHNDNPIFYECTFCQKVIKSKQMFRIHLSNKHEVKGVKNMVGTYGKEVDEHAYFEQKIAITE